MEPAQALHGWQCQGRAGNSKDLGYRNGILHRCVLLLRTSGRNGKVIEGCCRLQTIAWNVCMHHAHSFDSEIRWQRFNRRYHGHENDPVHAVLVKSCTHRTYGGFISIASLYNGRDYSVEGAASAACNGTSCFATIVCAASVYSVDRLRSCLSDVNNEGAPRRCNPPRCCFSQHASRAATPLT